MSTTNTIASIVQSLQSAAGAIRAKATQIVSQGQGIQGSEATFQLTGDSLANLQNQIDSLRRNTGGLATFIQNGGITPRTIGTDTQVIFNQKGALAGSPNMTFDYTDGIFTVLSVDGAYSVAIGEPTTGVGLAVTHLTSGDLVEIAGKTITCLKAGVAGDTIWELADNGSGVGKLAIANGSGTGGFDGNGEGIYGTGGGFLKASNLVAGNLALTSDQISLLSTSMAVTNVNGHQVFGLGSFSTGILTQWFADVAGSSKSSAVLDTTPGFGTFAIQNGSGTGGFDGLGASVYLVGSAGEVEAVNFHARDFTTLAIVDVTGDSIIATKPSTTSRAWYMATVTTAGPTLGTGLLGVSNGAGSGGFDSLGSTIYGTGSTGLLQLVSLNATLTSGYEVQINQAINLGFIATAPSGDSVNIGGGSPPEIYGLNGGVTGHYSWYLFGVSGAGWLGICDGSGSGGFFGGGEQVLITATHGAYGQVQSGRVETSNFSNSTAIILDSASSTESTLSMSNSLGSQILQISSLTTGSIFRLQDSSPGTFSFQVQLTTGSNPTAASATAGSASALPATPATYLQCITVNGTQYKIPMYNL